MRGNVPNDSLRRDGNIWVSEFKNSMWENPKMLPNTVNSDTLSEYYPISTNSGNLYFSREVGDDDYDIYVAKFNTGVYEEAQSVSELINTELLESDAYIDPKEEFMIFVRMYADDGQGVSDLYISFNNDGEWTAPTVMTSYNSSGVDGSPFVTADRKYLFFTSTRDSPNPENFDGYLNIYIAKFDLEDWLP